MIRSPAGVRDGTNKGFVAAKSRINLSAFSLPPITLVQARHPLSRGCVLARVGYHQFAFVLWFDEILQRFWRFGRLNNSSVINNADDSVSVGRPKVWIDKLFGKGASPKVSHTWPKNRLFGSVAS